ncbi:DEAD/DEAH box helicase [Shewanella woodyi]|uniref:Type III restriction protein res subunit n=1 Tax=Shewanella woodyi (strain ATCC 51908 / MS32) TaxID=392500 RepID=B1KNA8_SHEWM|nr:DEAD/DEAH box helicase family protein [Shewanella woodyi]ACA84605.1 type III restriction protein res subunit [Shewanella woodyi ATCC 51908]
MFQLKSYQQGALDTLASFFKRCRETNNIETSFSESLKENNFTDVPYRAYKFDNTPYVCVRIPTGGGKTILGTYAISTAAKEFLSKSYPITLWLVPTTTIQQQTVAALKSNPAYTEHLNKAFANNVSVYDIADVNQIRSQDIGNKAIIVVSTLANLRVTKTTDRKVYQYHEDFEPHFSKLTSANPAFDKLEKVTEDDVSENGLTVRDIGKVKYSFANLLALYNPLVIVDEAHNARTPLTFDTLKRVYPAAIMEFTATPNTTGTNASNILYHVSAAQLKAEEMIKLPIILTEHVNGWEEAVRDAVLTRERLAVKAQKDTDYIRPIVLLQAESKSGKVTVDVLKQCLMEQHHIDESKIAIATGTQRELDGLDIFQPDCPVEFVITIEALKEGWDCSFAYVFCSVKQVSSSKDAEQLLGRVLRMPYAKRRVIEDLNRAYAHLSTNSLAQAAKELADKLIAMGFEELEVATFLRQQDASQGELFDSSGNKKPESKLSPTTLMVEVKDVVDSTLLTEEDRSSIKVSEVEGRKVVTVTGKVSDTLKKALEKVAIEPKKSIERSIKMHNQSVYAAQSPSENGAKFAVLPRLCVMSQGELELAEKEVFLDAFGWNLLDYPAVLDYKPTEDTTSFSVDLQGKKVKYSFVDDTQTLNLNFANTDVTQDELVGWLDMECRQSDVTQREMTGFMSNVINHLMKKPELTLTTLIRNKYPLANAIQDLVSEYRKQAATKGYQQALFSNESEVLTTYDFSYEFKANNYPARPPYYSGSYDFNKHYYPQIEDMKSSGEEFDCAQIIDLMPEVKHWVRNLVRREEASFSLPLAHGNFFPDFIVELNDGRILVVEYKGEAYKTNDDSAEKRLVGDLWAKHSQGNCLFLMAVKKDDNGQGVRQQLLNIIS